MKKTKIDWCDCTINPVVGCPNGCPYCYARKINDRFHIIEKWDKPQFFPERLKQFESKKPQSIFIDSMSDIGCWEQNWLDATIKAIVENPQHRYIALTKQPDLLSDKLVAIAEQHGKGYYYDEPRKLFFGTSITTQAAMDRFKWKVDFYSIEPILQPIVLRDISFPEAIIIGAETGNRKGKVIPNKEWIGGIVRQADAHHSTVFMKESLRKIMGDDFRQDKLPWEIER